MPAPSRYVYLFEGYPEYDTGSGLEERTVLFFDGPEGVDGLLDSGVKAHIGLVQNLSSRVSIDHPLIGGGSGASTTFGEVSIAWAHGDYDAYFRPPYYWRGRPFILYRIPHSEWPDALALEPIFRGLIEDYQYDHRRVSLTVRDRMLSLERRLQQNVYTGAGTTLFGGPVEGPADLADVPKPITLGTVTNIEPVPVDRTLNLYQFHDGDHSPAEAVDGVFDRGVELDPCDDGAGSSADFAALSGLLGWTPVLGEYATHLAGGFVRMGGTPDGRVTIDAQGDAESNVAGTAFTDIWNLLVRRVAVGYAGLSSGLMDVDIATSGYDYKVGFYTGTQPVFCGEVIRRLAESGFGFAAFSRQSILGVGQFEVGTPAATIYAQQIKEFRVERAPMPADPVRIGYQRAWAVQGEGDLPPVSLTYVAGTVTDARRALVGNEYRYIQTATGALDYYPEAKARTVETLVSNGSDATGILLLALALQAAGWRRVALRVRDHTLARRVGETVTIEYGRFGFSAGLAGLVLAVTDNLSRDEAQLLVLVPNA